MDPAIPSSSSSDLYDVAIVGAGVSGLMLAHLLDSSSLRLLLLEKKSRLRVEPPTFGTFMETAEEHGLREHVAKVFDTWAFYGPTVKAERSRAGFACLVDYQSWVDNLRLERVVTKTGVVLEAARREQGCIVLVERDAVHRARLVVDSSGAGQVVQQLLGLAPHERSGLSYEVELEGCRIPVRDEASFILDFRVSNSGGWIYVLSPERAQFGWADFHPEAGATLDDLERRVLRAMIGTGPQRSWFKGAKVTYRHGRFGPKGAVIHRVHDRLLPIGDAGGLGTPVTLEGFRQALDSARMARDTIIEANDFTKSELEPFLDRFQKRHGRFYRVHEMVRHVYIHWFRNEDIDRWLGNFSKFDDDDFFRLIRGELSPSLMLRTLDPVLFVNVLLNVLSALLPPCLRFRPTITPAKRESIDARR